MPARTRSTSAWASTVVSSTTCSPCGSWTSSRSGTRPLLHATNRRMITYIVVDFIRTTQTQLTQAQPRSIDEVRARAQPLAMLSDSCREEHLELKAFLREQVYRHYKVLRMTSKAR